MYISKFKTNTAYSNTDINEVISAITGEGVLPHSPNDILATVSNDGVTLSDSRCAVSWADDEKTQIKIGAGTVIMPDGSYIIIADEILSVPSSKNCYVYIYQDIFLHNIPVCQEALPEDDKYVLLAQVENNVILDKRKHAKSKISQYGTYATQETSFSLTINTNKIPIGTPFASFEVGDGYTHAIIYNTVNDYFGILDMQTGIFKFTYSRINQKFGRDRATLSTGTSLSDVSARFVDGVLSLYSPKELYSIASVTMEICVIFF